MAQKLMDELRLIGVDVAGAVERLADSEEYFLTFLEKFLEDDNYDMLVKSVNEGDDTKAELCAHTLKGVTGNLGMNVLYGQFSKMVRILRKQEEGDLKAILCSAGEEYQRICAAIRAYL